MKNKSKAIFLDSDLASLFSEIEETKLTAVSCALVVQVVDRVIRKQPGRKKKSVVLTISGLHSDWFPFWCAAATKRILKKLRRLGIIKTQVIYKRIGKAPQRFTRIWIQEKRILELAEQVKAEIELVDMAKRVSEK